jgi:hypothetical protein
MIEDEPQNEPALDWWGTLTDKERDEWGDKVGRVLSGKFARRDSDIARDAYNEAFGKVSPEA